MAQDDFIVTQATYFSDQDQDVAVCLYQPLIGPTALALYLSLWRRVKQAPTATDRRPQTYLLDLLGVGVDALYDARVRLEALGLLQTYTTTDALGRYYAYELHRPVAPDAFFNDATLGLLLYDRVGDARYHELVDQYTLHNVHSSTWINISANLLDVFALQRVLPDAKAAAANASVQQKPAPAVTLGSGQGYDWALLAQLLARTNLKDGELNRNQAALYQIAKFYGLGPTALAPLIEQGIDFATGQLNVGTVRRFAEQRYTTKTPQLRTKTAEPTPAVSTPAAAGKLTAAEQDLLKRAASLPVREFLELTKKAKNPNMYAAQNEISAVRKLVQRHVLPDATINVLIDYILQTNDSVNQAFLDAIVNRWLKADVTTPESALAEIHAFANRKTRQSGRRNPRPTRSEQTPAWLKPDYQAEVTPVSDTNRQRIADRLARLQAMEKEGGQANEADEGRTE
ncbi:replication initiation and membrane attachment family protein [Lacticaseibacillus daqingensis]|uniref:replication initiation and membrane attachment family protein n=1 Tax=Lacticaseibacillus daqingensis TaxID=2486014 RepID=UPI001CDB61ED|nr:DnaD domain protein [Lacticaseibacillus daqingensis]